MDSLLPTSTNYLGYPRRAPLADDDETLSQSSAASGGAESINFESMLHNPVGPRYSALPANPVGPRARTNPTVQPRLAIMPSCHAIFACCARSPVGKMLGHGLTKGVAVFLPVGAYLVNYEDVGGHHDVAIGIGLGVWILSTAMSVYGRSTGRSVSGVVAESVGYGVAGLLLGPINLIEYCMTRDAPDPHVQPVPSDYEEIV